MPVQTWDHLTNLVKAGEFNDYGRQIGNLVPCCRDCNSTKGSSSFSKFVATLSISETEKKELIDRLKNHQLLVKEVDSSKRTKEEIELLEKYREIQNEVLALLKRGMSARKRYDN